ncbi:MAG: hypothetical protein ACJAVK_002161 [Akkermansiaceae bacterium]|jgi:hypothetical protein
MTTESIVSKVWSFCTTLRDDGVGYGDYLEQLTYLIFLKMADEYGQAPYNRDVGVPPQYNWATLKKLKEAYVSQHVALSRMINPELTEFLFLYIISPTGGRKDLEEAAYGAGKPGLNLTNIRELRVPLCSLPEQQEVVRLLDEQFEVIEQNEREIDAALKRSEALRQSILKKAFTGRLVPQDPTDEPASVLLDRIRSERELANKTPKKKTARKRAKIQ